jgi:flagellin
VTASFELADTVSPDGDVARFQADMQQALDAAGLAVTVGVRSWPNGDHRLEFTANAGSTTKITVTGDGADALQITTTETAGTVVAAASTAGSLADLVASGSQDALTLVDAALGTVLGRRSDLGAMQNRLEHRLSLLATTEQNTLQARSRIADADVAKEWAGVVRAQVLSQAGTALQAQAGQGGQRVLQLLTSLR